MFAILCLLLLAVNFDHPSFKKLIELEGEPKSWIKVNSGAGGIERWNLIDTSDETRRAEIVQLCKEVGLFDGVALSRTYYPTVLVYGATLPAVQKRMEYLLELWDRGVRFDKVFFLADLTTEYEMICKLVDETTFPPNFPPRKVVFAQGGPGMRANTKDTLRAVQQDLKPPVLAISTPMYVHYQQAAALSLLGKEYPIETYAKETGGTQFKVPVLLDTLAKILENSQ